VFNLSKIPHILCKLKINQNFQARSCAKPNRIQSKSSRLISLNLHLIYRKFIYDLFIGSLNSRKYKLSNNCMTVNNDIEKHKRILSWPNLRYNAGICLEQLRIMMKTSSRECRGMMLAAATPKCTTAALPLLPTCLVIIKCSRRHYRIVIASSTNLLPEKYHSRRQEYSGRGVISKP
jgi:hypothetical protein